MSVIPPSNPPSLLTMAVFALAASSGGQQSNSSGGHQGQQGGSWGRQDEGVKLYVGNLAWQTQIDDLGEYFSEVRAVTRPLIC